MQTYAKQLFDLLTAPGPRVPSLEQWLSDEVWSPRRFKTMTAQEYLESGEKIVKIAEELILASAPGVYDELTAASESGGSLLDELETGNVAVVVFDGVSLREFPLLIRLAETTGFAVTKRAFRYAGLPSDTLAFIQQRLIGKRVGPSQLESRKELRDFGVVARHYDTLIRNFDLPGDAKAFLLWSSFPDGTYTDFEARSSGHFETIVKQFDVAWKNVVMSIPRGFRIIVTSDHGYAYLNTGLESDLKAQRALELLNNERFKIFEDSAAMNFGIPELQEIPQRHTAMLRGKIKNRPQGPSGNKVFRHGGMSLMEMIVPTIELQHL